MTWTIVVLILGLWLGLIVLMGLSYKRSGDQEFHEREMAQPTGMAAVFGGPRRTPEPEEDDGA